MTHQMNMFCAKRQRALNGLQTYMQKKYNIYKGRTDRTKYDLMAKSCLQKKQLLQCTKDDIVAKMGYACNVCTTRSTLLYGRSNLYLHYDEQNMSVYVMLNILGRIEKLKADVSKNIRM